MTHFSRRIFLGALLGSAAGHALANAPVISPRPIARNGSRPVSAAPSAEHLIDQAKLTGKVSYFVADARTGKVLEERDGSTDLPPASVTKAITALYALEKLGSGYRYKTRLFVNGTVRNGHLQGDLILAGGGDPTLDTDALGDMAARLRAAGVTKVTGKFLVYGGALPNIEEIDQGQPVHVGYNPAISGLNLNFNRVHFEWKRQAGQYKLTMDARAKRFAPQVGIAKMRVVERSLPIYTYSQKGSSDHP